MDESSPSPPLPHRGWWFVWLASIPLTSFSSVLAIHRNGAAGLGFVTGMIIHLLSSLMLSRHAKGCWLPAMLYLGGWFLMAAVAFLGCTINVPY
jgi:hypothetical protein